MWLGTSRRNIDLELRYQILSSVSPKKCAAIMEVDGGLGRDAAERQAFARLADR